MTMNRTITWIAAGAALSMTAVALSGLARAGDWPMWGGNTTRNMASPEKNLPTKFKSGELIDGTDRVDPKTMQGVKWVAKLGSQAYGNPVVSQGKVFVGTNNEGNPDPRFKGDYSVLKCLDEKTGEMIWQLVVPKLGAGKVSDWEYLGICSSPTVEGDRVYIITNRCDVLCLDINGMSNGNDGFQDEAKYMANEGEGPVEVKSHDADILWRYDLRAELSVFPHNITSSAPLVVGDKVYCATSNGVDWSHTNIPNPKAPSLIALDKMTGELVGEEGAGLSERILHGGWSSPGYGEVDGKGIVLFGGPDGWLYGFGPEGKPDAEGFKILPELWRFDANPRNYRYKEGDTNKPIKYARPEGPSEFISTPVFYKGRVYAAIGQDPEHGEGVGRLVCVKIDGKGDVTDTKLVWDNKEIHRTISTVAIADGLLFVADFSGFVYCFDVETGKMHWKHDTLSHIWGSPLVADGKVYIGNEDGDVVILAASTELKEIAKINMGDPIYSSPVIANGVLYISTMTHLYAIDGK